MVGFQGSSGSRKNSFDSPGAMPEEAGGGEGAGLKQVGPWEDFFKTAPVLSFLTDKQTNRQTS